MNDHYSVAQALLRAGAQMDLAGSDGVAPLALAKTEHMRELLASAPAAQAASRGEKAPPRPAAAQAAAPKQQAATPEQAERQPQAKSDKQDLRRRRQRMKSDDRHLATLTLVAVVCSAAAHSSKGPAGNTWTDKDCAEIPLCEAAYVGTLPDAKELLAKPGVNVNEQDYLGSSALSYAAYTGRTSVVDALLKGGAKNDLQNEDGTTALMKAAATGHASVVEALLAAGARIDLQDTNGFCSLDVAKGDAVKALLRAAAKKTPAQRIAEAKAAEQQGNAWTDKNWRGIPLTYAAYKGKLPAVRELLAKPGANVNEQNKDGVTTLSMAANVGRASVVEALLKAVTRTDLRGKNGKTALDVAKGDDVKTLLWAAASFNYWLYITFRQVVTQVVMGVFVLGALFVGVVILLLVVQPLWDFVQRRNKKAKEKTAKDQRWAAAAQAKKAEAESRKAAEQHTIATKMGKDRAKRERKAANTQQQEQAQQENEAEKVKQQQETEEKKQQEKAAKARAIDERRLREGRAEAERMRQAQAEAARLEQQRLAVVRTPEQQWVEGWLESFGLEHLTELLVAEAEFDRVSLAQLGKSNSREQIMQMLGADIGVEGKRLKLLAREIHKHSLSEEEAAEIVDEAPQMSSEGVPSGGGGSRDDYAESFVSAQSVVSSANSTSTARAEQASIDSDNPVICSITLDIVRNLVAAADGHNYERERCKEFARKQERRREPRNQRGARPTPHAVRLTAPQIRVAPPPLLVLVLVTLVGARQIADSGIPRIGGQIAGFPVLFVPEVAPSVASALPALLKTNSISGKAQDPAIKYVVMEFYAPWCPHCQHMAPVMERVGEAFNAHATGVLVCRVNCVAQSGICNKFQIQGYPTVHFGTPAQYYAAETSVRGKELIVCTPSVCLR